MARGKYAARADRRLEVLESEKLREAHAEIRDLKTQLAAAQQEIKTTNAQVQSKAMQAAAHLSAKEKTDLRNRIASLEHHSAEQAIRHAVLTWEVMHREKFDRPSPAKLLNPDRHPDQEFPEPRDDLKDSCEFWFSVHWELAALFITNYDDMWRFFETAQGYSWRMAGDTDIGTNARENTRNLRKGPLRDHMMRRVNEMRAYYDRIWKARQAGKTEPITRFTEIVGKDESPADTRDRLIKNLRDRR